MTTKYPWGCGNGFFVLSAVWLDSYHIMAWGRRIRVISIWSPNCEVFGDHNEVYFTKFIEVSLLEMIQALISSRVIGLSCFSKMAARPHGHI
jgi:hypothetical protein